MKRDIRSEVESALPELLGVPASITQWSGPHPREWSWHFRMQAEGSAGGDMLLKIPRWEEAPTLDAALAAGEQESTRAEIEGLLRIQRAVAASGDPGLVAVEPVGYVASLNGILLRVLPGESLRERLGTGSGKGDMAALFGRLGRWIALFHTSGEEPERRTFDSASTVTRFQEMERLVMASGSAPRGLLPALERLQRVAHVLDGATELWAETHGDLNLSNVLVGRDDRIAVIDPNREVGPAVTDPVRVATDLALEQSQIMTRGVLRSKRTRDSWEHRLFAGAGFDGEETLRFRLAEAAVARWSQLELDLVRTARVGLVVGRGHLRRNVNDRLDALL